MQCFLQVLEYVFLAPWCLPQVKQTIKPHANKLPTIVMYRRIFYSLFITFKTPFPQYGICCMFLFLGEKSLVLIGRLLRVEIWLVNKLSRYMSDSIEVTRLIFSREEAVRSEGLVFLLEGLYGNLVIIWKYYLLMDFS